MDSNYLFVYGTLQENVGNNMSEYLSRNSKMLGKGYILGRLYKVSWFPGAVLSDLEKDKIFGTLFKLETPKETFKVLDAYEGFNANSIQASLFKRVIAPVILDKRKTINAWVYIYNKSLKGCERIVSGSFLV